MSSDGAVPVSPGILMSRHGPVSRVQSALVVALMSAILVVPALLNAPGIGIIVALVAIGLLLWRRRTGLRAMGFRRPRSWIRTVVLGLLIALAAQFGSYGILEPFIQQMTGQPPDLAEFDSLRGDLGMLAMWLAVVWLFVAFTEEFIFRGFMIRETMNLLGQGRATLYANLLFCSALFGLAHWYQGPGGVLSTGLVGLLMGYLFVRTGFNLWLPVFVHGFIDTIGLTLIYLDVV